LQKRGRAGEHLRQQGVSDLNGKKVADRMEAEKKEEETGDKRRARVREVWKREKTTRQKEAANFDSTHGEDLHNWTTKKFESKGKEN